MIGLPGDSRKKALHTAEEVVKIKPDILKDLSHISGKGYLS